MNVNRLSGRDGDVLRMLCAGQSDREIAEALGITPASVRRHTQAIRAQTGERSIAALCRQIEPEKRRARLPRP